MQDGITGYFLRDGHGDIQTAYAEDRTTKLADYTYDAWGNQNNTEALSWGENNPIRYAGQSYDTESGMFYLRARYYNPDIGRFINEDPIKDGLNWYAYCGNNPVIFVDPSGLKDYAVVIAAGINTDRSSDYFAWLKNEIQYRMNTQGDNVRFIEVYPYGEAKDTSILDQGSEVMSDANYSTRIGADYVNWQITEANIQDNETIIMIGHSGGGTAVTGAYYYMDDKHKEKVSQIVTIGSPKMTILTASQQNKTTRIIDNNDIVPKLGNDNGAIAKHRVTVHNGYSGNSNSIKSHVTYFDSAQKAANILNSFWERAM